MALSAEGWSIFIPNGSAPLTLKMIFAGVCAMLGDVSAEAGIRGTTGGGFSSHFSLLFSLLWSLNEVLNRKVSGGGGAVTRQPETDRIN